MIINSVSGTVNTLIPNVVTFYLFLKIRESNFMHMGGD